MGLIPLRYNLQKQMVPRTELMVNVHLLILPNIQMQSHKSVACISEMCKVRDSSHKQLLCVVKYGLNAFNVGF